MFSSAEQKTEHQPDPAYRKVADIEGSKIPNRYDSYFTNSMAASYARGVLESGDSAFYDAPSDAADLSRVVIAIENFLRAKKNSGTTADELLNPLELKSLAWAAIIENYAEFKTLILEDTAPEMVSQALRSRINEVTRRTALAYLPEAEAELRKQLMSLRFFSKESKTSGCSFYLSNIDLANAIILKATERQFHVTLQQKEGMESAHGPMHRTTTSVIYNPKFDSNNPRLLDPKNHNGSTFTLRIQPQVFHCEPIEPIPDSAMRREPKSR